MSEIKSVNYLFRIIPFAHNRIYALNSNSSGPGFSSIITQANFRSNGIPMLAATIDAQFSVANQPIIIAVE